MPAWTHHSPIFYEELPKSKKSMLAKDRLEGQKIVMEKVKLCSWCWLMCACVQCSVLEKAVVSQAPEVTLACLKKPFPGILIGQMEGGNLTDQF